MSKNTLNKCYIAYYSNSESPPSPFVIFQNIARVSKERNEAEMHLLILDLVFLLRERL